MTIYKLFIFDRHGTCLFYRAWFQKPQNAKAVEQEKKLLFGLMYSVKDFVNKMSPRSLDATENAGWYSYTTSDYKLHYFETLSGLRFALTTDPNQSSLQQTLRSIYHLYVSLIVKNPLYKIGTVISIPQFIAQVDALCKSIPSP
eukprot:gb/GEZN01026726.1/.p1 GENE.gb/GEZN01026726.1/~~gb/GEZN01026726.1/.p1  ORF type:complete len:144 (+),score=10.96 gb/GEZN01026726.1/:77-508(+)